MYCNSPEVKRNGRSITGKQRYLCLICTRSYYWNEYQEKASRRYSWFKQWIEEGYSVRELAKMKRTSQSTVRRVINYWLKQTPPNQNQDYSETKHLILDGTFLHRPTCIYAAMDSQTHRLVLAAYNIKENPSDLMSFYGYLAEAGMSPKSATTDGNAVQGKQLKKLWPDIQLQRCIVHVQRQGLSWCRRIPKRTDAKHLRELFLNLTRVKAKQEAQKFIKAVFAWEKRFGSPIESSPNRGKVFSDVIRARSMLLKALPNLFLYLDDSNIARSTNAVEGYFSRLKEHYRLHRGLSKTNRYNYFKWYFYLKQK